MVEDWIFLVAGCIIKCISRILAYLKNYVPRDEMSPRWTPDVQLCASQSTAAGVRVSQTVTAGQSHSVTGWSAAGGGVLGTNTSPGHCGLKWIIGVSRVECGDGWWAHVVVH